MKSVLRWGSEQSRGKAVLEPCSLWPAFPSRQAALGWPYSPTAVVPSAPAPRKSSHPSRELLLQLASSPAPEDGLPFLAAPVSLFSCSHLLRGECSPHPPGPFLCGVYSTCQTRCDLLSSGYPAVSLPWPALERAEVSFHIPPFIKCMLLEPDGGCESLSVRCLEHAAAEGTHKQNTGIRG